VSSTDNPGNGAQQDSPPVAENVGTTSPEAEAASPEVPGGQPGGPAGGAPSEAVTPQAGTPEAPAPGDAAVADPTADAPVPAPPKPRPMAPRPVPRPAPQPAAAPADGAEPVVEAPAVPASDPTQWGRVDADGTVYVKTEDGERAVGSWQAGEPVEGLAHFARRFDDLRTEVELLVSRLKSGAGDPKHAMTSAKHVKEQLAEVALGGTAVGTGINAHPKFGAEFAAVLAKQTGIAFRPAEDYFEALSSQDTAVELSGQLKTTAVSIMKIANDLRWMNSGPLAGLAEVALPDLQPGSSIMPGKVNPVIPEAAAMVAAQVIGNDAAITIAGQSGNFQLNVMLPLVARNLLESIELLANVSSALADAAIKGFKVNQKKLDDALDRNPILVTALNSVIGYDKGAAIAKQAYKEGRAIREVAAEQTKLPPEQLRRLLDPLELTKGGIKG
jgi:hypothetical protein